MYRIELVVAYLLYCSGVYWVRRVWLHWRGASVVLVYHRVLAGARGRGEMVGEHALERQLRYLTRRCRPVDWKEMVWPTTRGRGIRVLVTFDDGYRDNFTRALPLLEHYQIPAVYFTVTDFVFRRQRIEPDENERDEDIFPAVRDIQRARESEWVTFGNHTASHPIVSNLDSAGCAREIELSQAAFRHELGIQPTVFAYPRGREEDLSPAMAAILEREGFQAAFTMVPGLVGRAVRPFGVPRIGVSHVNDDVLFRVKILGLLGPFVRLKNKLERVQRK